MDLTTALGLKRELEAFFMNDLSGSQPRFALGVAMPTATTGYRVAVRTPTNDDLRPRALELLRLETAGELDVRVVGEIDALGAHALSTTRGVAIGASVAHHLCGAGTLGFFARRVSDGVVGLVSNNHVIAAGDRGQEGDPILHPAPADHGRCPDHVVAYLSADYPRLTDGDAIVDCAFARLADGKAHDVSSLDAGRRIGDVSAPPEAEPDVCKIGRTTGLTFGRITAFDLNPEVNYSCGSVRFHHQIEIDSTSDDPFSRPGDSGSLVFTRSLLPVALVFAGSASGGQRNAGLTYANPIEAVIAALGVTLIT